ncbi:hypothetical protein HLB23_39585 [Nocardia uniformis]|uniref:Uncharacterized protein n=1 Tax=Nocardia uniformis TaxID=53432 RepID=A0A849CG46_9NOCA|nr:hypothetical protein [Nocardia uniformis]NNH75890.1 hypothetical protein [Nocardia uniformis]
MRGATRSLTLAGSAAAIALAVAGCGDSTSEDSKSDYGATSAAAETSRKAAATVLPGEAVQCGPGPWGLSVVVYTAKGPDFCSTATSVANDYAAQRDKQADGDIAVTVDNIRWVCGERSGDPNPFQECASQNESADVIRLFS